MSPEVLEFPLNKKHLSNKMDPSRLSPGEIQYVIERTKDINSVPVILSFKYKGHLTLSVIEGHAVLKVRHKKQEFGFIIKISN